MEDMIDDVVEQVALVADHEDGRAIVLEEILEPQRRFEIEMVRGLVEQQQSGSENSSAPSATRIFQPPE